MESSTVQQNYSNNQGFLSPSILQIRLETGEIINRMQQFLSGEILLPQRQPDGSTKFVTQSIGKRICNEKGVQHWINFIQGVVNPAVVQGNYTPEQYQNHVDRIHRSVSRQLVANYHEWGMSYEDLEMINDTLMNLIEPFLSRLIENKERESYAQTLKGQEISKIENTGGFSLFGGKK
jgi:hypothetical protein